MIIREVEQADIPALSALARKTYTETFGHTFTPSDLALYLENTRSEAYFRIAMYSDTILVAIDGDALIGYVQICDVNLPVEAATDQDQQVNALYVRSDYQGRGIGKHLMDAALTHPRLQNAENIYLDVWDQNVKALNLYKRYGFEVIGETPVIIDSRVLGSDLVMLRRARTQQP
jgi:ribosomal protein S18 acetylase RimI-like enzyme